MSQTIEINAPVQKKEVSTMDKIEKQKISKALRSDFRLHEGYSEDADLISIYGERATELAIMLIEVVKNEKGLTYAEANASLQIVHERLKFESNFVKLS